MAVFAAHPQFLNHIPNYNVSGEQHSSHPFKDVAKLHNEDIRHAKWLQPQQGVRSRSELQQARQIGRVPDRTYDFDGDGVVGSLDLFVGSQFDREKRGHLSTPERRRAREALDGGLLDKYITGIDSHGKDYYIRQKRGVILQADNMQDCSIKLYPPGPSAHVVPHHTTQTGLHLSRRAEASACGAQLADRVAAASEFATERQPPNHRTEPRKCAIGNLRERAQAENEAARAKAGLLPMSAVVNPERELKEVGMDYIAQPVFASRSQLMETRRQAHRREVEELAIKGVETCVPLTARLIEKASAEYEFRRPTETPMTCTRMQEQRRLDKIEYDMAHFQNPGCGKAYPLFSDKPEVPFWQRGQAASPPAPRPMPRSVSEPALKVTDVPPLPARAVAASAMSAPTSPQLARSVGNSTQELPDLMGGGGSVHVKRWTAEILERGDCARLPRLFDSLKPYREKAEDSIDLELKSSMLITREAALDRLRLQRAREREEHLNEKMAQQLARQRKNQGSRWTDPGSPVASHASVAGPENVSHECESTLPSKETLPRGVSKVKVIGRPKMVVSEPRLRGCEVEVPHEPRSYGTSHYIESPQAQAAVRCGGFHKFTPTLAAPASKSEPRLSRGVSRGAASRGASRSASRGSPTGASGSPMGAASS